MRIIPYFIFALVLWTSGCDDQDQITFCQVASVGDLTWLQEEIENGQYESSNIMDVTVYQATYNGKTVIIKVICCPVCGLTPADVKDCNGTTLGQLGVDIDADIINNGRVIWKTRNGVCS